MQGLLIQDHIRIMNAEGEEPESETTLYVIDALQFISKFKLVLGYCMCTDSIGDSDKN
jgi:hypothetical protein